LTGTNFTNFSENQLTTFVAVSQKRCEIGPTLLSITNIKPYKPFQLTPKSTTLDNPNSSAQMMRLSELTTEI